MPRNDNYPDDMRQYDHDPRSPEYVGDDDEANEDDLFIEPDDDDGSDDVDYFFDPLR